MKVLVSGAEQRPYSFERYPDVEVVRHPLPSGDYSLPGMHEGGPISIAIERKELNDLIACLMGSNRERFERELMRGRSFDVFVVVVEATLLEVSRGEYRSGMNSHAAIQSILALQLRHRISFIWAGDRSGGEYVTYSLLVKYLYEIRKRHEASVKEQDSKAIVRPSKGA